MFSTQNTEILFRSKISIKLEVFIQPTNIKKTVIIIYRCSIHIHCLHFNCWGFHFIDMPLALIPYLPAVGGALVFNGRRDGPFR